MSNITPEELIEMLRSLKSKDAPREDLNDLLLQAAMTEMNEKGDLHKLLTTEVNRIGKATHEFAIASKVVPGLVHTMVAAAGMQNVVHNHGHSSAIKLMLTIIMDSGVCVAHLISGLIEFVEENPDDFEGVRVETHELKGDDETCH